MHTLVLPSLLVFPPMDENLHDNGNSVNVYVLLSEGILDRIHKFSLGEWTSESNHICIDLKCMHRVDCQKSMNLKRAPMYSKMVEDMLQIHDKDTTWCHTRMQMGSF